MIKYLIILILMSSNLYAEDVATYSGETYTGCRSIGDTNIFLNNPNDYDTVKDGYIYMPLGCKTIPNVEHKYLRQINREIIEMTNGEKIALDTILATQLDLDAKQEIKGLVDSSPDSAIRLQKAIAYVTFLSIMETRMKVNELVTAVNTATGGSITALPNRTWAQLKTAVKNEIDSPNGA